MDKFAFTLLSRETKRYVSWVTQAPSKDHAFMELRSGDAPDELVFLSDALSEWQVYEWVRYAARASVTQVPLIGAHALEVLGHRMFHVDKSEHGGLTEYTLWATDSAGGARRALITRTTLEELRADVISGMSEAIVTFGYGG